jgi:hypothetical protein
MDFSSTALSAAATLAAGAYFNARFGLSNDLNELSLARLFGENHGRKLKALGDKCTLYGIFERVDEGLEALWFEGRTWTYGQLKNGT